jgi:hypothetical protein
MYVSEEHITSIVRSENQQSKKQACDRYLAATGNYIPEDGNINMDSFLHCNIKRAFYL